MMPAESCELGQSDSPDPANSVKNDLRSPFNPEIGINDAHHKAMSTEKNNLGFKTQKT